MLRFAARRLAQMALVLLVVSVATFLIFQVVPGGDPAQRMAPAGASDVQIAAIEREWDFDRSLPVQYATTMRKILTGDARSYFTRLDVLDEIGRALPRTLSLAIGGALLSLVLGASLGLLAAARAGRLADRAVGAVALLGMAMPVFWLGALLAHYAGFEAGVFPDGGYVPLTENPLRWAHHLALPWLALSLFFIGAYARLTRAAALDALGEDWVRTARAKGLTERQVMTRHVLPATLAPVLAVWGLDFGVIVGGGAILTETVFGLQGVGQYAADSIGQLDVPPVLAVTLLGSFFIVALNALVDIAQAALDPRVRP